VKRTSAVGKLRIVMLLSLLVVASVIAGLYYASLSPHLDIEHTNDGWVCHSEISYSIRSPRNRPILCGDGVVVVDVHPKDSRLDRPRQAYYVTRLLLEDGREVYSRKIRVKGCLLQLTGMWSWDESIVLQGYYYQEDKEQWKRAYLFLVLDENGKTVSQFAGSQPAVVDSENDLLLCVAKREEDVQGKDTSAHVLRLLSLPSGQMKTEVPVSDVWDMATDRNGYIYLTSRPPAADNNEPTFQMVQKYRVDPWECVWSAKVKSSESGYRLLLGYGSGSLWCYDTGGQSGADSRFEFAGTRLDPETGAELADSEKYDPYITKTSFNGKKFIMTRIGNSMHVKTQ